MHHYDNLLTIAERQGWDSVRGWGDMPNGAKRVLLKAAPHPDDMVRRLSAGLVKPQYMDIQITGNYMSFSVFRKTAGIEKMKRTWVFRPNYMNMNEIKVYEQKQGIAKRVLKSTVDLALDLGLESLALNARDDGSWVWARAGFVPSDEWEFAALGEQVWRNFQELHSDAETEMEIESCFDYGVKGIWDLADHDLGPDLLISTEWNGEFILSDRESLNRLRNW